VQCLELEPRFYGVFLLDIVFVIPISILYQNENFVLVDKPAGLNFHSEQQPGLVVQLAEQLNQRLYPVHRLDKMTSGLLLLAKSAATAQEFQRLFEAQQIEKYYLAISTQKPKKKQGWIKGDMQLSRRGNYRLNHTHDNPAITQFISSALGSGERVFLVKPHTGKTHQIRVALKSLGAPIAGDLRYQNRADAQKEDRGYLHAYGLRFKLMQDDYSFISLPSTGQRFVNQALKLQCEHWNPPWIRF